MKKFPIGIQSFKRIIEEDYIYVDKTKLIYELVTEGVAYFFSRPRRFGKSLLLSTLEALFKEKKELFKDLWIADSDYHWRQHTVIFLDFSQLISSSPEALSQTLQERLQKNKINYPIITINSNRHYRSNQNILLQIHTIESRNQNFILKFH